MSLRFINTKPIEKVRPGSMSKRPISNVLSVFYPEAPSSHGHHQSRKTWCSSSPRKARFPKSNMVRIEKLTQAEKDGTSEDFRRTRAPITRLPAPPESGFYAIYLRTRGLLLPFRDGENGLIYIGLSNCLADRAFDQHFSTERTGSSTLRRSLGALLKGRLSLTAIQRGAGFSKANVGNYRFVGDGEARLTAWMRDHLEVGVHSSSDYLRLERLLIPELGPLLNLTKWPNPQALEIRRLRKLCADEASRVRGTWDGRKTVV